ncbi:hypothetical protein Chor_007068, partial [Crotalus horridus]
AQNILCYKTFDETSGTCRNLLGDEISQEDCCLNHQYGFQAAQHGPCQSCREARWNEWSSWSACSVSCTEGVQRRSRVCYGSRAGTCLSDTREREMKSCLQKECCPTHGNWGNWGPWQHCSHTCTIEGSAVKPQQLRLRLCNNPPPSINPQGKACPGGSQESQSCTGLPFCPRDGNWGSWKSFQTCSVTCGVGQTLQKRLCDNPAPKYGGQNCLGEDIRRQPCTIRVPCPVDGYWKEWTPWKPCSRYEIDFDIECKDIPASQIRTRTCTGRRHEGKRCAGSTSESRACYNFEGCRGEYWESETRREPGQLGVLGVSVNQPVDLNLKDLVRESVRPSTLIIRKKVVTGENGKQQNVTFWGNPQPQCKRLEGQDLEVVEETPCQNVPPCEG